jgi:hypothetical protein
MTKRKKQFYPPAKTATKRAPAPGTEESPVRPNLATINLSAGAGRAGLSVGDRVRIEASGIYSGEIAVIERLSSGVIPSALVRTESGGTRQVRTIDLVPAAPAKPEAAKSTEAAPQSAPSSSEAPS